MDKYRIAIVGATGLVGQELVRILEERRFPAANLNLYAVEGAAGRTITGVNRAYPIQVRDHTTEQDAFRDTDLVFLTEGDNISRHWAPLAKSAGVTVIDSSSVYRLEPDVPLVITEINPEDLEGNRGIIASPNCSAILLNSVLYPLHKANSIKKVIVSTYQSTSGMGAPAMNELTVQTQQVLAGETPKAVVFPHEIGFNILPQVDVFLDNGYTKEEWQLLEETRKILHNDSILVSATCVRVPTFKGHCQAVTIQFTHRVNPDTAGDILAKAPGVRVVDDPTVGLYPHPRMAAGTDLVMVGRIRQDTFDLNGLALWIVGDNIRKGAALNMVQIAEEINKKGWLKAKGKR